MTERRYLDEYEWPSHSGLSDLDIVGIVLGGIFLLMIIWSIRSKLIKEQEEGVEDESYRIFVDGTEEEEDA